MGVLVLVLAANAETLRSTFVSDDWALLHTFQGDGAFQFWITPSRSPLYRPVSWGGLALLHSAFGLHPLPYHLVAVACVLGASATTWCVARRVGLGPHGAAIAALAFGVHPALAWGESWAACIGSPLGDLFAAQALLQLLRPSPTVRQQAGAVLLTLLAIGSHETFAALPAVVLVLRLGLSEGAPSERLRHALRGTIPVWVVAGTVVVVQALRKEPAAADAYQDRLVGWHVPRHMARLLEQLTGVVLGSPGRVATTSGEVLAGVAWVVLLAAGLAAFRAGHRLGLLGLVATIPALYPISILVTHTMDPYYLEVALLPFALAVGSMGQTVVDGLPATARLPFTAAVALGATVLGGVCIARNLDDGVLGALRQRQQVLLAQVRAAYPDGLPAEITVHTSDVVYDSVATYKGDLFKVRFGRPALRVVFAP